MASAGYHIVMMIINYLKERDHVVVINVEKIALQSKYVIAPIPKRMALKQMVVEMDLGKIQTFSLIQECP